MPAISVSKIPIPFSGGGGTSLWSSYWTSQTPETDVPADVVTMTDDFTGVVIDTAKWDIIDPADGVTISQNETLILTVNKASTVASTLTNNAKTVSSIVSGYVEFTIGGTMMSNGGEGTLVVNLHSSMSAPDYQAQIITLAAGAALRIRTNATQVYEYQTGLDIKRTWRIEYNYGAVRYYYLSAPSVWTQVGTTQRFDIANGNELKFFIGSSSVGGSSGTRTWTVDNFSMVEYPNIQIISDVLLIANQPAQNNRWYGRPVTKRLKNNVWMMVYANSESHPGLTWSQLHIKFTDDYAVTWSDEDKYLDGTAITNFPMYPPNSAPGVNANGPGDGVILQCTDSPDHLLLQMWESNYGNYLNGTWQSETTDGGKTWSVPVKIAWVNNTGTPHDDERCFATDQSFTYDGIIYNGVREYQTDAVSAAIRSWLATSVDNGVTWELISLLSAFTDGTQEYGLEYVGNNTIVACLRDNVGPKAYWNKSLDMGATWEGLTEVQATVGIWSRPRVYTRSHLKGTNNWWNDPLVICHGFVHVTSGVSVPRRLAVWISRDSGDTFIGPMWLKVQGYDGGYGDLLYNPVTDEYVTVQYYGPTSYLDGEIRQINWKIV